MPLLLLLFAVCGAAVSAFAFANVRSDVQVIIALVGLFAAPTLLGLAAVSGAVRDIRRDLRDIADAVDDLAPDARDAEATGDFHAAVLLHQKRSGVEDTSAAIRDLAAHSLRQRGLLK